MKKLLSKIKSLFTKKIDYERCWRCEINTNMDYNPVVCKGCPYEERCSKL